MKWSAIEWSLIILSVSVAVSILLPAVIRIATGQPLSDNYAATLSNYIQSVGTGILSIVAMILGKKWTENKKEDK